MAKKERTPKPYNGFVRLSEEDKTKLDYLTEKRGQSINTLITRLIRSAWDMESENGKA